MREQGTGRREHRERRKEKAEERRALGTGGGEAQRDDVPEGTRAGESSEHSDGRLKCRVKTSKQSRRCLRRVSGGVQIAEISGAAKLEGGRRERRGDERRGV